MRLTAWRIEPSPVSPNASSDLCTSWGANKVFNCRLSHRPPCVGQTDCQRTPAGRPVFPHAVSLVKSIRPHGPLPGWVAARVRSAHATPPLAEIRRFYFLDLTGYTPTNTRGVGKGIIGLESWVQTPGLGVESPAEAVYRETLDSDFDCGAIDGRNGIRRGPLVFAGDTLRRRR